MRIETGASIRGKRVEGRLAAPLAAVAAAALLAAGCEVTNPGPVKDEFITSLPTSQEGFIRGSQERLSRAVGNLAYTAPALAAREIFPGGQTGSYGFAVTAQAGQYGNINASGQYNNAQQARWIAEEAIRRFKELGDVEARIIAEAHIWAGYANRVLGENWCDAVIDGGGLEPGSVYFERAEKHFTDALQLAANETQKRAALAGRAQARMWLENWAGAVADAQQVPTSFNWWLEMDFTRGGDTNQRNHVYWAAANTPYRSYTVRFTYYDQYYKDTGDPRTPWKDYPTTAAKNCSASLQGFGSVPCTQQQKYTSQDDDIRLSGGAEMRLIEAEALLTQGNWQAAMSLINALRATYISRTTNQPLQPWTATNLEEAWTILKRERGIELWLEARRAPDLRRWEPIIGEPKTPGDPALPDFESKSNIFTVYPRGRPLVQGQDYPRALCYAISTTERNNNPNLEDAVDG